MTFRRSASVLGTIAVVLATYGAPASAHGVEVTADVGEAKATLELTDETGEVCVAIDPAPQNSAVVAIAESAGGEVRLILGEGFGPGSRCQFFDVDIVNSVLADVDAHRLVIAFGNDESSGVLTKPRLSDSETATGEVSEETAPGDVVTPEAAETNVPLVFGIGLALGLGAVLIRKRFFSK